MQHSICPMLPMMCKEYGTDRRLRADVKGSDVVSLRSMLMVEEFQMDIFSTGWRREGIRHKNCTNYHS